MRILIGIPKTRIRKKHWHLNTVQEQFGKNVSMCIASFYYIRNTPHWTLSVKTL